MSSSGYKGRLYGEFARVAQALASDRRLELVDLLAQAPRRVEALAAETGMTLANVSQHLQVLKNARLVESERRGTTVTYRLASPEVVSLWLSLCDLTAHRLPELVRLRGEFSSETEGLLREELRDLMKRGEALLIDVRPAVEFESGHIEGAVWLPLDELPVRLDELPRDKRIVAYCRGEYCLMADEAVSILRERGYDAIRLDGGWPEWSTEQAKPQTKARSQRAATVGKRGGRHG